MNHRPFTGKHSHPERRRSAAELRQMGHDFAATKERKRAGGTRNVPRPGQVGESNGLTHRIGESDWPAKRIGEKNLAHEPKPPAIGFLYEDLAPSLKVPRAVFGQYPRSLIPALLPWLKCERREILHVCSGSLPPGEGIRVDLRPDAHPDVLADGRCLPFRDGSQAAVMLDPPYTKHYARDLYGVEYPRPSHLLREAARVVRPGGRLVFVHYITPNPPPRCHFIKAFGLSTGFGFPMRAVSIYERSQADLAEVTDQ